MRIGLPKGSLTKKSRSFLAQHIGVSTDEKKLHYTDAEGNHFYLLKQRDMPGMLRDGQLDIAVVSTEWITETESVLTIVTTLGWSDTHISLLVPEETEEFLKKERPITCITEFPNIAEQFFKNEGVDAIVRAASGSTEAFVPSVFDCAVDCVETGRTIRTHGLKEYRTILKAHFVVATAREPSSDLTKILRNLSAV